MSLIAKPPALVMLAGALWLTAVDLAWAESAGSNRERFVALVANRQNQCHRQPAPAASHADHCTQSQRLLSSRMS